MGRERLVRLDRTAASAERGRGRQHDRREHTGTGSPRYHVGYPEQLRSRRISRIVPATEIAIDPPHPSLFEKKTNMRAHQFIAWHP